MLNPVLMTLGHLIALSLYGIVALLLFPLVLLGVVLVLALGLVAAVGLFGGLACLLKGDRRTSLTLLGAGAGAWVAPRGIVDRLFATGAFLNCSYRTVSIPDSHPHIDFDR